MHILTPDIHGVDHIGHKAGTDRIQNFGRTIVNLSADAGFDAILAQEKGCTGSRLDIEAQLIEAANQRKRLLLILIRNGGKNSTVIQKLHTGCLKGFIQSSGHGIVITDGLAGGLHLRREVGVQAPELGEGECGRLDIIALFFVGIEQIHTLIVQAVTEGNPGRNIRKGIARCLTQEGYRSGRTGVDLDDKYIVIRVNDKLNVEQALDTNGGAKLLGILQNNALDLVGNREGGIDRNGVAGMHAGSLHQLHNAGNKYLRSIADRVDFDFLAANIFVNQHRLVRVDFHCCLQIMAELRFVGHDLHGAPAENEGGTHQNRVADFLCRGNAIFNSRYRAALGLRNIQLQQ